MEIADSGVVVELACLRNCTLPRFDTAYRADNRGQAGLAYRSCPTTMTRHGCPPGQNFRDLFGEMLPRSDVRRPPQSSACGVPTVQRSHVAPWGGDA